MGTTEANVATATPFTLEIVAHCFCYDRILCYFLSSFLSFPPADVRVTATIFYCPQDEPTANVLNQFTNYRHPHVTWNWWPLERPLLLRRAIGRNLAAKATTADLIWFTDVDYLLGPGCIDAIPAQIADSQSPLFYPRTSLRNSSDAAGDAMIERVTGPGVYAIDPADLPTPEKNNRAIGGIQLVRGDVARARGYLPDSKWQVPAETWQRTREDTRYRKSLGTKGERIHLPNLYRLRHAKKGRDDAGCRN